MLDEQQYTIIDLPFVPFPDDFDPMRERELAIQTYAKVLGIPLEDLYPAIDVTPNAHETKANI